MSLGWRAPFVGCLSLVLAQSPAASQASPTMRASSIALIPHPFCSRPAFDPTRYSFGSSSIPCSLHHLAASDYPHHTLLEHCTTQAYALGIQEPTASKLPRVGGRLEADLIFVGHSHRQEFAASPGIAPIIPVKIRVMYSGSGSVENWLALAGNSGMRRPNLVEPCSARVIIKQAREIYCSSPIRRVRPSSCVIFKKSGFPSSISLLSSSDVCVAKSIPPTDQGTNHPYLN